MLATLHFHWYLLFYLTNTTFAMALAPLAVLALFRLRDRPTPGLLRALRRRPRPRHPQPLQLRDLRRGARRRRPRRARLARPPPAPPRAPLPRHRLLMLLPHVAWIAQNWSILSGDVAGPDHRPRGAALRPPRADGLGTSPRPRSASSSPRSASWPPSASPAPSAPSPSPTPSAPPASPSSRRLVLFCLGLMLLYVAAGSAYVKPHHLFFLAFAPLWLIARLDAADARPLAPAGLRGGPRRLRRPRRARLSLHQPRRRAGCDACEEFQPIDAYAAALRAAGFERGTILALSRRQDFPTAALRSAFPEARILAADYRVYAPPPLAIPGDCLLVWSGAEEWPPPLGRRRRRARPRASACPSPPMPASATHPRQGPPLRPRRPRPPLRAGQGRPRRLPLSTGADTRGRPGARDPFSRAGSIHAEGRPRQGRSGRFTKSAKDRSVGA